MRKEDVFLSHTDDSPSESVNVLSTSPSTSISRSAANGRRQENSTAFQRARLSISMSCILWSSFPPARTQQIHPESARETDEPVSVHHEDEARCHSTLGWGLLSWHQATTAGRHYASSDAGSKLSSTRRHLIFKTVTSLCLFFFALR